MHLMTADIEEISRFIIERCQAQSIDLLESHRQRLIGLAIKTFREQGLRMMREVIEWELFLMFELQHKERKVYIDLEKIQYQKGFDEFLLMIGSKMKRDEKGDYFKVPKKFSVVDIRHRIKVFMLK
jgi:hypothetical protein